MADLDVPNPRNPTLDVAAYDYQSITNSLKRRTPLRHDVVDSIGEGPHKRAKYDTYLDWEQRASIMRMALETERAVFEEARANLSTRLAGVEKALADEKQQREADADGFRQSLQNQEAERARELAQSEANLEEQMSRAVGVLEAKNAQLEHDAAELRQELAEQLEAEKANLRGGYQQKVQDQLATQKQQHAKEAGDIIAKLQAELQQSKADNERLIAEKTELESAWLKHTRALTTEWAQQQERQQRMAIAWKWAQDHSQDINMKLAQEQQQKKEFEEMKERDADLKAKNLELETRLSQHQRKEKEAAMEIERMQLTKPQQKASGRGSIQKPHKNTKSVQPAGGKTIGGRISKRSHGGQDTTSAALLRLQADSKKTYRTGSDDASDDEDEGENDMSDGGNDDDHAAMDSIDPGDEPEDGFNLQPTIHLKPSDFWKVEEKFDRRDIGDIPFGRRISDEAEDWMMYFTRQTWGHVDDNNVKYVKCEFSDYNMKPNDPDCNILPLSKALKKGSKAKAEYVQDCMFAQIPELQLRAAEQVTGGVLDIRGVAGEGQRERNEFCAEQQNDPARFQRVLDTLVSMPRFEIACREWWDRAGLYKDSPQSFKRPPVRGMLPWPPKFDEVVSDRSGTVWKDVSRVIEAERKRTREEELAKRPENLGFGDGLHLSENGDRDEMMEDSGQDSDGDMSQVFGLGSSTTSFGSSMTSLASTTTRNVQMPSETFGKRMSMQGSFADSIQAEDDVL